MAQKYSILQHFVIFGAVGNQLSADQTIGLRIIGGECGQLRAPLLDEAVCERRPLRPRPRVFLLRVRKGLQRRPLRHSSVQGDGTRHRGAAQ
jgi:hypothetical protein